MTSREFNGITLERVRDYVWEIPQEGGMNAPARVLASDALLSEIADDKTLEQLRNASHLPGITSHAICMPDGHQGYGFPVGGVGAIDAETGCISPGAVGYDINCLTGDSEVHLSFGRRRPISDLRADFEHERAVVPTGQTDAASEIRLFTETPAKQVYEIETATGETITASPDHPVRTPEGMVEARDLEPGMSVFTRPFEGLPDEKPPTRVLVDEGEVVSADAGPSEGSPVGDLLPLRSTDRAVNRLLKLVGYHTGAGSFDGTQTWFYGDARGLKRLRADIAALGFEPTAVMECTSPRDSNGTLPGTFTHKVGVESSEFRALLVQLGAPTPEADRDGISVPEYLHDLAAWQRALYLSAFFGAAMSAPVGRAGTSITPPAVTRASPVADRTGGTGFFRSLADLLEELGIPTSRPQRAHDSGRNPHERSGARLVITDDPATLVEFLSRIGYRYAWGKRRAAALVSQYLARTRPEAGDVGVDSPRVSLRADGGIDATEDGAAGGGARASCREAALALESDPRPDDQAHLSFAEFTDRVSVRADLTVATPVVAVRDAGRQPVYDIGVTHESHAFVADGVVVGNCGVRMMRTDLTYDDVRGREEELVEALFANIPSGLGGGGIVEGDGETIEAVLRRGVDWAVEHGYATRDDLARCEDEGRRPDARPEFVSQKAKDRGRNQLGSLGSGNHFLEVQRVTDLYDSETAAAFGLREDQVVVLIHCGSRGLGHQVCTDFLREIEEEHADLLAELPDKELAAAPAGSRLAEEYYGAMCAAINFAWVNRQLVMHRTRRVFERVFGEDWEAMGMELLYDVAHNIAKREVHDVGIDADGRAVPSDRAVDTEERELFVHRKGATRAFPAGRPEVPATYRDVGQPVIIPGSMGAGSYVLVGGDASMAETFGSTAHGAGRVMSRTRAKNEYWGETVQDELREQQAIYVKAQSGATVAEEAPGVYKDVDEVVRVSDALGIGDKVARTYPVCNIKG